MPSTCRPGSIIKYVISKFYVKKKNFTSLTRSFVIYTTD
jgi:hypothetical protein